MQGVLRDIRWAFFIHDILIDESFEEGNDVINLLLVPDRLLAELAVQRRIGRVYISPVLRGQVIEFLRFAVGTYRIPRRGIRVALHVKQQGFS